MRNLRFLYEFVKHPRRVGSLVPSSPFLANKMLSEIDFSLARNVVEFGSGTGAITRHVLSKMDKQATLYCFETNPRFVQGLRKIKDNRVRVVQDSAEKIASYVPSADVVISGLPLAVMPCHVNERILDGIHKVLGQQGVFVQFQYSLHSRAELCKHFDVDLRFTLLNIPPAFVYVCRSYRAS